MEDETERLSTLAETRPKGSRLMGLDLGTKTIGIAYCDIGLSIATARETLARTKFTKDAAYLMEQANKETVFAFILGLPLNMDGTEGPRAQSTRAFARNLSNLTDIPVLFEDERLSTHAAEQAMLEADLSRKKRAAKIDAVAAAIILQAALDRLARL